jgi:hypothetical protein
MSISNNFQSSVTDLVNGLITSFSEQIAKGLNGIPQGTVITGDHITQILQIPANISPSVSTPMTRRGAIPTASTGPGCQYVFTRGANKGAACKIAVVPGDLYCKACLKKRTVIGQTANAPVGQASIQKDHPSNNPVIINTAAYSFNPAINRESTCGYLLVAKGNEMIAIGCDTNNNGHIRSVDENDTASLSSLNLQIGKIPCEKLQALAGTHTVNGIDYNNQSAGTPVAATTMAPYLPSVSIPTTTPTTLPEITSLGVTPVSNPVVVQQTVASTIPDLSSLNLSGVLGGQ